MKWNITSHGRNILCGVALLLAVMAVPRAEAATLEATLIYASEEPASMDRRMDNIEFRLRRLFKFEHYQLLDQKISALGPNSETTINFVDGHSLHLTTGKGGEKGFPVTMVWSQGGKKLMSTGIKVGKSKPAILGGPSYRQGSLILSLELK